MGMDISFTGIKNIKISRDITPREVRYIYNGEQNRGVADFLGINIKCDLVNDTNGNHLSEFVEACQKSGFNIINKEQPNHFELTTNRFSIQEDDWHLVTQTIAVNGTDITLNTPKHRSLLKLYSFIADLTRNFNKLCRVPEHAKNVSKQANQMIANTAEQFIDEII